MEESQAAMEAKVILLVTRSGVGGAITIASLCPHTPVSAAEQQREAGSSNARSSEL